MNYRPPVGYSFVVLFLSPSTFVVDGIAGGAGLDSNFKEVLGLTSTISVEQYWEGGVNDYQHPLPKPAAYGNISLKRGMLVRSELALWIQDSIENFNFEPRDLLIILKGPGGIPEAAWAVENAIPQKWEISGFNSMDNAVVIESIDLAIRRHRRIPTSVLKGQVPNS